EAHEVDEQPRPPAEDAPQVDVEGQLGDRGIAPDGRHLAVVEVPELLGPPPAHQAPHLTPGEVALLKGDGRHLEVGPTLVVAGGGQVADDEDVVERGRTEVAPDDDAATRTSLQP